MVASLATRVYMGSMRDQEFPSRARSAGQMPNLQIANWFLQGQKSETLRSTIKSDGTLPKVPAAAETKIQVDKLKRKKNTFLTTRLRKITGSKQEAAADCVPLVSLSLPS